MFILKTEVYNLSGIAKFGFYSYYSTNIYFYYQICPAVGKNQAPDKEIKLTIWGNQIMC